MADIWYGEPDPCDFCHKPVTDGFVDGKTRVRGIWGTMCLKCYPLYGLGIRPGLGQKYLKQNNQYVKVEG